MYQQPNYFKLKKFIGLEPSEGESMEQKLRRIKTNKEGIGAEVGPIYTQRKDGIMPQLDIRTDKFETAIEAMDKKAEILRNRRNAKVKEQIEAENPPKTGKIDLEKGEQGQSTQGTDNK